MASQAHWAWPELRFPQLTLKCWRSLRLISYQATMAKEKKSFYDVGLPSKPTWSI